MKWKYFERRINDLQSLKSRNELSDYGDEELSELLQIKEELSKLHQHTVISAVCDNCRDVQGMYLGMTCPKCNRPFRDVKQTDL